MNNEKTACENDHYILMHQLRTVNIELLKILKANLVSNITTKVLKQPLHTSNLNQVLSFILVVTE